MVNSLIVPPYRAALLTNADGSPVIRDDSPNGGGPIATERLWYMFWRQLGDQANTAAQQIEGLEGLVTYGNHADRPDPDFAHSGALYVEWDRGSVIYQNQGGTWVYIAGIMYGTLTPDQRPADLGPSADVGFQFRTSTSPARAFVWNGGQWVETTPIRYGTHAERLAAPVANLVSGMLWMETDRGSVIYQNQGGTWLYLAGTMWGTLSPDQRPTDLGVHDAGFDFRTTVAPSREFIWNQVAWVETTASQTPWTSNIDAAGFQLLNTGNLGVGVTSAPARLTVGGGRSSFTPNSEPYAIGLQFGPGAFPVLFLGANSSGDLIVSSSAGTMLFSVTAAGRIVMPTLPTANPGAGTKQLWFDPADSNRVKYAP